MVKSVKKLECITCQNLALSSFCTLKEEELKRLNKHKHSQNIKKNQIIFSEGGRATGLHCLHQGKIKLYKTLPDGTMQVLRIASDGDLIGYRGLLGDGHYIATGIALEDCVVCFIPQEHIFELIKTNVQFSMEIMANLAADIRLAEEKSVSYAQKSTRTRLAETLLLFQKTYGTTSDGFINIALTREDLGSIAGMVTETTVRVLKEWSDLGIIQLEKKFIKILKPDELYQIAELED